MRPRSGRLHIAVLIFLAAFAAFLVFLSSYYLLPALEAFRDADRTGRKAISATSTLLLAVLLFSLVAGILLTFRIGRFFFPRNSPPRSRTKYVDVWSEAGKRIKTPPEDDDQP